MMYIVLLYIFLKLIRDIIFCAKFIALLDLL